MYRETGRGCLGTGLQRIGLMRIELRGYEGLGEVYSFDFVLPTCSSKAGQASRSFEICLQRRSASQRG